MSTQDGTAEIIDAYRNFRVEGYVLYTSLIPLVYDYLLNLTREVELFWLRKPTGASFLYFAASCDILVKTVLTIDNLQSVAPAVFSGLRAFALTKSLIACLTIFLLSSAPLAANLYQYHLGVAGEILPIVGCAETYSITEAEIVILTVVSRAGSILADFLLVVITWRSLKTSPVVAELARGAQASLASIMLWNGSQYFLFLFLLNVLHLSFTLSSILRPESGATSFLAEFTNPLTAILVCRFLLDLQAAGRQDVRLDGDDMPPAGGRSSSSAGTGAGSVVFARVLGSIGSTVVPSDLAGDQCSDGRLSGMEV